MALPCSKSFGCFFFKKNGADSHLRLFDPTPPPALSASRQLGSEPQHFSCHGTHLKMAMFIQHAGVYRGSSKSPMAEEFDSLTQQWPVCPVTQMGICLGNVSSTSKSCRRVASSIKSFLSLSWLSYGPAWFLMVLWILILFTFLPTLWDWKSFWNREHIYLNRQWILRKQWRCQNEWVTNRKGARKIRESLVQISWMSISLISFNHHFNICGLFLKTKVIPFSSPQALFRVCKS